MIQGPVAGEVGEEGWRPVGCGGKARPGCGEGGGRGEVLSKGPLVKCKSNLKSHRRATSGEAV